MSLAMRTASSSSVKRSTVSTGPKDSSCTTRIVVSHSSSTVGRKK